MKNLVCQKCHNNILKDNGMGRANYCMINEFFLNRLFDYTDPIFTSFSPDKCKEFHFNPNWKNRK